LGFAVWVYEKIPRLEIHDVGVYHTVFMDLLRNSPDPERDLRDLGLDPSLRRYVGRHAYMEGSPLGLPDFRASFFDRFDYGKLVGFYLSRPGRLIERLERAGRRSFRLRPKTLANLGHASGARANTLVEHASTWSRWRLALGASGIVWIGVLLGANILFGV